MIGLSLKFGGVAGLPRFESEEGRFQKSLESKIKGPGPFRSMSLMVLRNFRGLCQLAGPGFSLFPRVFKGLAGTFREGGDHGR